MLNIYLVGSGVIAKMHAKAAQHLPCANQVQLHATDISEDARSAFREEFPEAIVYTQLDEMLQAKPPSPLDIVVVCTPPFAHLEPVRKALASGRHVLCEKPLAISSQEARDMLELAIAKGVHLACCSSRFLGTSTTEKVKQLLSTGALGELYHVAFKDVRSRGRSGIEYQPGSRWFLDRSRSGGGVLMDWGPYDFAVLNDVLQPLSVDIVQAWTANPVTALDFDETVVNDVEQHAGAVMVYHQADGSRVTVTYERSACEHGPEMNLALIQGTRGAVEWNWQCFDHSGEVHMYSDEAGALVKHSQTLGSEIPLHDRPLLYFYQLLTGVKGHALVDEQSVFNLDCIQAIYHTARTGHPQKVQWSGRLYDGT
ncbi:Gfo/Idh/MocA family oxidoreductase [Paenibacillus sp. F411]|uniref:Gfo/Idh/MocA family protein n=1 Tax=Paenibacillus sp. F411 TaxID=2820239 RepID=UPI001FBA4FDC|nr:Gfo/Idh/MocA family oxidoreductase [Paenibacillus sp. F411]